MLPFRGNVSNGGKDISYYFGMNAHQILKHVASNNFDMSSKHDSKIKLFRSFETFLLWTYMTDELPNCWYHYIKIMTLLNLSYLRSIMEYLKITKNVSWLSQEKNAISLQSNNHTLFKLIPTIRNPERWKFIKTTNMQESNIRFIAMIEFNI